MITSPNDRTDRDAVAVARPGAALTSPLSASPLDHRPTVFVVDDDPLYCKSVTLMLRSTSLAVECFVEPKTFLFTCEPDWHGCMLLDLAMPEMSGTELRRQLVLKGCRQPFAVVSGSADVSMAVRAMQLGAVDYLLKPVERDKLIDVVSRALRLDEAQRNTRAKTAALQTRLELLTPREHQVLELVVAGLLSKEIAKRLGISIKTVEVHRSNIMRKMKADSLAQLVGSVARYDCQKPDAASDDGAPVPR
jgi:RNA polymerase sigma factor (sigma-70 family)